jgi:hypothetical protein
MMHPISITRRGFLGSAAVSLCVAAAPFPPTETLAASGLRHDVGLLREVYEALHPGLLRYNSSGTTASRFDALADAASRGPMSLSAFYLLVSRFLGTVRCGHSYANFYNQPKATRTALFENADRLPFAFRWLGSRMVVTGDPHGIGIARGSEIVAIDGMPVGRLLSDLMPLARADGHNDAKRRRLMSMQSEDRYESFDVFFSLLAGRPRYSLLMESPDGRRSTRIVDAVALAERRKVMRTPAATGDSPVWTMERRGASAVLTMPSWALYDSKWDWRNWLDAEIDRLVAERVPALVVDLRGNEGGLDCGDRIVERLISRPTPASDARRLVRYRTVPDAMLRKLDTWDHACDDWGAAAQPFDSRFFQLTGPDQGVRILNPRGRRYAGSVRVLTDPQNSSATHQFAELVRRERLAALIGEPTGGNCRGLNGGYFYTLTLPASQVEVDVPLVGLFPTRTQPDAGVVPDVAAAPSRDDIASGADAAMARALS